VKPAELCRDLLDLLLPRGCLGCRERIPPEEADGLVCARCRTHLRPAPPPRCSRCDHPLGTGLSDGEICLECRDWPAALASARAVVILEPPADALVHALKYGGWRSLGEFLGRRMAKLCRPVGRGCVVVPIPTTPRRRRIRGYNQAEILARVVAGITGAPLVEALERPGGRTQVRLGPRERDANVRGSFRLTVPKSSRINGREVILIDDVLTTGATARSAAGVLAEGGASKVRLVTFARALPFSAGGHRRSLGS
jgi:ComF family protein